MNKADLYHQNKITSMVDSQEVLESFTSAFKWRADGGDSVLDAGCGSGDVTYELLLPFVPANFERLVAVDLSKEMIEFARKKYVHPKLTFEQFDLNAELEKQPLQSAGPFDHIFSFYTLQWIQNQKLCMETFYKLLKEGGDMCLMFLAHYPVHAVYLEQSRDLRWAQYMKDVNRIVSPYHNSKNAGEGFHDLLSVCGFKEINAKAVDKYYSYTLESLTGLVHSINPFIDRMPADDRPVYLHDLIEKVLKKSKIDVDESKTRRIHLPYRLMVAFARK